MPFFFLIGFYGHGVTTLISIFEALMRYLFGMNGFSRPLDSVFQTIRMCGLTILLFFLLNFHLYIPILVGIATLFVYFPIFFFYDLKYKLLPIVSYSIFASLISTLISLLVVKKNLKTTGYISIFISLSDHVLKFIFSNHRYFFFHFHFPIPFKKTPIRKYLHQLMQLVSGHFFLTTFIQECKLHNLIKAILIIHIIFRSSTESINFTIFVTLVVWTLPYEIFLTNFDSNCLIGFLISSKFYSLINFLRLSALNQVSMLWQSYIESGPDYFFYIFIRYLEFVIFFIHPLKIFSLLWSLITGAPMPSLVCWGGIFFPSPIRPNYFWDNALTSIKPFNKTLMESNIDEMPTYITLEYSLMKNLFSLIQSGDLGNVHSGDIYLFTKFDHIAFLHILSVSPTYVSFQIRGLEYLHTTSCHGGERSILQQVSDYYSYFPNMEASFLCALSVYDLRISQLNLNCISFTKYQFPNAIIGVTSMQILSSFFAAFCNIVLRNENNLAKNCFEANQSIFLTEQMKQYFLDCCNFYHRKFSDEQISFLLAAWIEFASHCFNRSFYLDYEKVFKLFNSYFQISLFNLCFDFGVEMLAKISQFGLVYAFLITTNISAIPDFSPEINKDIIDSIESLHEMYFIGSISQIDFIDLFNQQEKAVFYFDTKRTNF